MQPLPSASSPNFRTYNPDVDYYSFLKLLDEFFLSVHNTNLNYIEPSGVHLLQAKFYKYKNDGYLFDVMDVNGELKGFHIYMIWHGLICLTEACYFVPQFRSKGLVFQFIKPLEELGVKRFIFQTYKDQVPDGFKKEDARQRIVAENGERIICWEWQRDGFANNFR